MSISHRYFFNSFISLNTYNITNQNQFREFVAKAPFVSGTTFKQILSKSSADYCSNSCQLVNQSSPLQSINCSHLECLNVIHDDSITNFLIPRGNQSKRLPHQKKISTELNQSQVTKMSSQSVININVLIQEVEDTMDENYIETGADYQDVIQMLVELRKSIRENEHNLHTEIPDPIRVYR